MAIYSTFLQRAYDQVVHDVALQNLPVRFCMDRAGLVGADGATHAGAFDLAYLCCLPNMTVMAAADEAELVHMVATAHVHDSGPIALRYPRGEGVGLELPERGEALPIGKGRVVRRDAEARVAVLSSGTRLSEALKAADLLAEQGVAVTVADSRLQAARRGADPGAGARARGADHDRGGLRGGFGAMVLQHLADGALSMRCASRCARWRCRIVPGSGQAREDVRRGGARCRSIVKTALTALPAASGKAEPASNVVSVRRRPR